MRNIFEDSCTEDGTGEGKAIFEAGLNFAASEARKKFDSTASAVQIEDDWYVSSYTQEYQTLEAKMKHRVK